MTPETINKLKRELGRWFKPTVARHRLHVETCTRLNCVDLVEPFPTFAQEVINAPPEERDSLLAIEPCEPYVPHVTYKQYSTPITAEMFGGSPPGKRGKRGKKKRSGK